MLPKIWLKGDPMVIMKLNVLSQAQSQRQKQTTTAIQISTIDDTPLLNNNEIEYFHPGPKQRE